MDPGPNVRLSDAERQRAVDGLFAAHRDGRIDLDELDQRLRVVYAARTVGQLSGPLADLPGPRPWSPRAQDVEQVDATGGLSRTGAWTVSRWTRIEQPMDGTGTVFLDFTGAEVPFPRIDVEVVLGIGRARHLPGPARRRGRPVRCDRARTPGPGGRAAGTGTGWPAPRGRRERRSTLRGPRPVPGRYPLVGTHVTPAVP